MSVSNMSRLCQDSEYMVAVRNYITEDRSLLNFHKGDIIRLQHMDGLEAGEMHRKKQKLTHIGPAVCFSEPCTVCPCFCVLHAVSVALCVRMSMCVFRQILRLHSEEEGHASGGAEERHS